MKRINITFYDETLEKLKVRTDEKRCGSIANSVRELVDLGLRIEEAAEQKGRGESESDGLSIMINLMKSNVRWTLETLLITRLAIEELVESTGKNPSELLENCKEKAMLHVQKIFSGAGEKNTNVS